MNRWSNTGRTIQQYTSHASQNNGSTVARTGIAASAGEAGALVGFCGGGLRRHGHAEGGALPVKHLEDQLRVCAGRHRHRARLCNTASWVPPNVLLGNSWRPRVFTRVYWRLLPKRSCLTLFVYNLSMEMNDPCTNITRADATTLRRVS